MKNTDKYDDKANIERVHVQTGLSKKNIEMTYINNGYGKDKSKILKVLSLGAICAEKDITLAELIIVVECAIQLREVDGIS